MRRSHSGSPGYSGRGRDRQSRSRSPRERSSKRRSRSPYPARSQSPPGALSASAASSKSSSHRKSSSKHSSSSLAFQTSMAAELLKLRNARHRAQQREAQRAESDRTASPKPSAKSVINTPDVIALSDGTPSPTPSYNRGPAEPQQLPNSDPHRNGEHSGSQGYNTDTYYGPRTPPDYDRPDGRGDFPREPPPLHPFPDEQPPPPPSEEPLPFSSLRDTAVPPPPPQARRASLAQLPLPPVGSDQDSDMDIDNSPEDGCVVSFRSLRHIWAAAMESRKLAMKSKQYVF